MNPLFCAAKSLRQLSGRIYGAVGLGMELGESWSAHFSS